MTLMITLNIILSISFPLMSHPLSLGLILMMQTITVSMLTGNLNHNMWFSYILFLIMIGGMLILFTYMTSVASNEKFSTKPSLMILFFSFLMIMVMIFSNQLVSMISLTNNETLNFQKSINNSASTKFFTPPSNLILILLIFYLFITMVAVVKITNIKSGPLRQKN